MPHDVTPPQEHYIPAALNPLDQLRAARDRALSRCADVEGIAEQAFAHIKVLEDREKQHVERIAELEARIALLTPTEDIAA